MEYILKSYTSISSENLFTHEIKSAVFFLSLG